jgi:glycosyltransferase involved in cell wall biosynthesis
MSFSTGTIFATANTSWFLHNFETGLLHSLNNRGWRIVVAAPPDDYSERLRAGGFDFYPLEMTSKGTNPFRDLQLLRTYISLLRATKPDVLLPFTVKPTVYGSLAARLLGVPVIPTITGLGSSFIRGGPVLHVVKQLYRAALSHAHHLIFLNLDDLALFRTESLIRDEQPVSLVAGSGVDPEHFAPRPRQENRAFTFLLAARMLRDKGVVEYVDAGRVIRSRFPNTRLVLLGKAEVDNPSAISRAQIEQWQRDGDVEYFAETDDVRPFIAESDAVVLPSYREGLPRILLEAASMMRPIVTTDTTGCREVVAEGYNGFLCKPRDSADLASAMERMLLLPDADRERMAAHGRRRVIEQFSEDNVVAAYVEAVERVVATRSSGQTRR